MTAREWLDAYARRLELDPPTAEELRQILDLAAEAAHGSERIAAPVACWLSARAGQPLGPAIAMAREVSGNRDHPGAG